MPYNSLYAIREQKGLTVAQLAGKTSISIRTLQFYEAGEKAIPPDDLRKLSRVLLAATADILRQPATPPPARPVPAPVVASVPVAPPAFVATAPATPAKPPAPVERPAPAIEQEPVRQPIPPRPRAADDGAAAPRPRPVRPPREVPPPRPPGPPTAGQEEQIRHLARRLGIDENALAERVGGPLSDLDRTSAKSAIARLRSELEASGTWQPRAGEGPDREGDYLKKLGEQRMSLEIKLIDGDTIVGTVVDFTPYLIRVRRDDGTDVSVRKLAIAYYLTRGLINDSQ